MLVDDELEGFTVMESNLYVLNFMKSDSFRIQARGVEGVEIIRGLEMIEREEEDEGLGMMGECDGMISSCFEISSSNAVTLSCSEDIWFINMERMGLSWIYGHWEACSFLIILLSFQPHWTSQAKHTTSYELILKHKHIFTYHKHCWNKTNEMKQNRVK